MNPQLEVKRLTPAEIKTVGWALYGAHWTSELVRELKIHPVTMRRWLQGTVEPRRSLRTELKQLCNKRQGEIRNASLHLIPSYAQTLDTAKVEA